MSEESVLAQMLDAHERIMEAHETNTILAGKIRKFLYSIIALFSIFAIMAYGDARVTKSEVDVNRKTIEANIEKLQEMKQNNITYEHFMLFIHTFELQLEETQAVKADDVARQKAVQKKYKELRDMLAVQMKTRGGEEKN